MDAYPGQVFKGQVAVVSPVLNPATRSAELEVVVPNTDRRLRAGMYAQVKVVLGERRALLVPRQAVIRAPGRPTSPGPSTTPARVPASARAGP